MSRFSAIREYLREPEKPAKEEKFATCPYCGFDECEADYVDIGVGEIQCSPFICHNCNAVQIGLEKTPDLTEEEKKKWWYHPSRFSGDNTPRGVNTVDGLPVDTTTAKALYRMVLLDKK